MQTNKQTKQIQKKTLNKNKYNTHKVNANIKQSSKQTNKQHKATNQPTKQTLHLLTTATSTAAFSFLKTKKNLVVFLTFLALETPNGFGGFDGFSSD